MTINEKSIKILKKVFPEHTDQLRTDLVQINNIILNLESSLLKKAADSFKLDEDYMSSEQYQEIAKELRKFRELVRLNVGETFWDEEDELDNTEDFDKNDFDEEDQLDNRDDVCSESLEFSLNLKNDNSSNFDEEDSDHEANEEIKIMTLNHNIKKNKLAYSQPIFFEIYNTKYFVKHWRDILRKTLSIIYAKDPKKFLSNFPEKLKGRKRSYVSFSNQNLHTPRLIDGTNIYVESNLSAESIFNLLNEIVKLSRVNSESFKICIKTNDKSE